MTDLILPCASLSWMDSKRYFERLDALASYLKQLGYPTYEFNYHCERSSALEVRKQAFEAIYHNDTASLEVIIYHQGQVGRAACSGFIWDDWLKTADKAIVFVKLAQPDVYAQLPSETYFKQPLSDCALFHPEPLTGPVLLEQALALEDAALAQAHIVNSEGASLTISYDFYCVMNSAGLRVAIPSSSYAQGVSVLAGNQGGQEVDGAYEHYHKWSMLQDPSILGALAGKRAQAKLSPKTLKSGLYPIVFSPRCSGSLIKHLCGALSGRAQYLEATFLNKSRGQRVLPEWLELSDHPLLPGGPQSYPIDADGLSTRPHTLIRDGIVQDYLLSYYSALRLGLEPNALASGLMNATLTTNVQHLSDIVKLYPKCLVIDQVTGTGVNTVTGDYSRGVDGFYYEHGERLHPLTDVTIASNLKDMLMGIEFHANDHEPHKGLRVGSLGLAKMMVSGGQAGE